MKFSGLLAVIVVAAAVSGGSGYSFGYLHGYEYCREIIDNDPNYHEFQRWNVAQQAKRDAAAGMNDRPASP